MIDKLDKEERDILESYQMGEWKSEPNIEKRKDEMKKNARATMRKDKRVNILISERDLKELQRQAVYEGLPYQTFISSILHKFVNGNLSEHSSG